MDLRKVETKIEKMLQAIIEDLINGVEQERSGYRTPDAFDILSSKEERELLRAGILEKNLKSMIRLNFRNTSRLQQLKTLSLQLKQLDYFLKTTEIIKADLEKLRNASETLSRVSKKLKGLPEKWSIVIALGWWKMLESSGMPGLTDEILKEGFSPKDWTIKAVSSSLQLAMEVARKFGQVANFKEIVSFLGEIGIIDWREDSPSLEVESETIEKIKKVLRWAESIEKLTQETIKMLGFIWFSFFLLESSDLTPISEEVASKFIEVIWSNTESLLEKTRTDLLQKLEKTMEGLIAQQITWAVDIFRVPEVI